MIIRKFVINFLIVLIPLLAVGFLGYRYLQERGAVEPVDTDTETVDPTLPEEEEPVNPVPAGTLDCTDCWLAPVDKDHALKASYAPSTIALNLPGGGSLIKEAAEALRDMFAAADADAVDMSVRSAYRSYETQKDTFEKWVASEMAKGYSRTEAEARANEYSAKPGHSEHQLGTTVDLLCAGCDFDSTPTNEAVWQWLKQNAGDFGFVLPYPDGRTDETGYQYEPWHYRYIGKSRAKEFNKQSTLTLNNWLASKY